MQIKLPKHLFESLLKMGFQANDFGVASA